MSVYGSFLKNERRVPSLPPMSRITSPASRCLSARQLSATFSRMRAIDEFVLLVYGYESYIAVRSSRLPSCTSPQVVPSSFLRHMTRSSGYLVASFRYSRVWGNTEERYCSPISMHGMRSVFPHTRHRSILGATFKVDFCMRSQL